MILFILSEDRDFGRDSFRLVDSGCFSAKTIANAMARLGMHDAEILAAAEREDLYFPQAGRGRTEPLCRLLTWQWLVNFGPAPSIAEDMLESFLALPVELVSHLLPAWRKEHAKYEAEFDQEITDHIRAHWLAIDQVLEEMERRVKRHFNLP